MSAQRQSHVYRRGDPLDIPLIDNHLVIHLLFPRIISAIKWVLPKLHLDWTTGADGVIVGGSGDFGTHDADRIKNPLMWKRFVEILLHTSLLFGSSQLIQQRRKDDSLIGTSSIRTPAMRNLGMFLKPGSNITVRASRNRNENRRRIIDALKSRIHLYSKLLLLLGATVIAPRLYEELKYRRHRQLREQDLQRRSIAIRLPSRPTANNQNLSHQDREQNTISERANDRQSCLKSMLSDFVIGIVDVFVPPLKLINYISYLWGLSSSPDLAMMLAGWEYGSFADSSEPSVIGFGQQYQRHANFHYGNRRLLVEEALRTVSAVIPPRENAAVIVNPAPREGSNESATSDGDRSDHVSAQTGTTTESRRGLGRRSSWFRNRALSFMGVIEDKDDGKKCSMYNLRCAKCGTKNPTIPYLTSCSHCYCYVCIRMSVTDGLSFQCLECGKPVTSSCPANFNEVQR